MINQYPLQMVDTPQVLPIPGGATGFHTMYLSFEVPPLTGTVTVEYREIGAKAFSALRLATNVDITSGELAVRVDRTIASVRVQFSGLSNGSGPSIWIRSQSMPQDAFSGLAAIITQPYTEANVKNGLQLYIRAVWPKAAPIPAGQTRKLWFTTGSSPIIVKSRVMEFDAEELRLQLFTGPTGVTGGTDITPRNYNLVSPVPALSAAKKNVTTTADGVPFDPDDPEYFFGAANAPQRNPGGIQQGRERILPANTGFIVSITNTGTGNARVQYFLDYYQGGTDIPL